MPMASHGMSTFLLILVAIITIQSASSFHQDYGTGFNRTFLGEIESVLGIQERQAIEKRIAGIEEALGSLYATIPKNKHGKLGLATSRYVLHRFFMQCGWSVIGLEPAGETWSSGSPTKILQGHKRDRIQHLFDKLLDDQGLDLHHIAVLAATFKQLVRAEMIQRLRAAYKANRLRPETALDLQRVQKIFDAYMTSLIAGRNITTMSSAEVRELTEYTSEVYQFWDQSRMFVHIIQQGVFGSRKLNFALMEKVAEEIGDKIGPWRKTECLKHKHELMEIEVRGSGRVRLADFYRIALHEDKPHFGENVEYLQQIGALEDSDPHNLQVIIPNWINGISNCFAASNFFSVCCINECEDLLGQFERQFQYPSATPVEIVTFTQTLPSDSVLANRILPASLVRRLHEIAKNHGGRVPLHGRLFAQWMHHAYPRECPFPHLAGTTNPQRVDDWEQETGKEVGASEEEMQEHIDAAVFPHLRGENVHEEDQEFAPWIDTEEFAPWLDNEELF